MIITSILENDLHRSKDKERQPLMVEVPSKSDFIPCVISNTHGEFVISYKLFEDNGREYSRVGIFDHDQSKIDLVINDLFTAAYLLSIKQGWSNIFSPDGSVSKQKAVSNAFNYIFKQSGEIGQPSVCLIPDSFDKDTIIEWFDDGTIDVNSMGVYKYHKWCRLVSTNTDRIVFLSLPEYVGMYTHFLSGGVGFLLHNVRRAIAFVEI